MAKLTMWSIENSNLNFQTLFFSFQISKKIYYPTSKTTTKKNWKKIKTKKNNNNSNGNKNWFITIKFKRQKNGIFLIVIAKQRGKKKFHPNLSLKLVVVVVVYISLKTIIIIKSKSVIICCHSSSKKKIQLSTTSSLNYGSWWFNDIVAVLLLMAIGHCLRNLRIWMLLLLMMIIMLRQWNSHNLQF